MEEQIITQIKSYIETIKTFDRTRFYPSSVQVAPWNGFSFIGVKKFVDDTLDVLLLLSSKNNLETYGYDVLVNIRDILNNIINAYNSYLGVATNAITSENHSILNYVQSLTAILKSSSLYIDLKFDLKNESKDLKHALEFAKELNKNKPAYETSISVFQEALKDKDKFTSSIINEKGVLYNQAAEENSFFYIKKYNLKKVKVRRWYKDYLFNYVHFAGNFWQLLLSFLFAGVASYIVIDFIRLVHDDPELKITASFVLLRLSSLIIPAYFSYFFSKQYLNSKKLYEFYKFKGIALTTLSQLYPIYPNSQPQIMEKALNVLFSEFHEDPKEVSQKDLFSFMTDIVKSKV